MPRQSSTTASLKLFTAVNLQSPVAVYQQIENLVQFAVASEQLKAGDQLPTVRDMSEALDINSNTVAKAYRDLEVMGYLTTRRGMGVSVNEGVDTACRIKCQKRVVQRLYEAAAEAHMAGIPASTVNDAIRSARGKAVAPYGETPEVVLKMVK